MKTAITPHKTSSKLTICNTERPSYKLPHSQDQSDKNTSFESNDSKGKSTFTNSSHNNKNGNDYNKENRESQSPLKNPLRKKPKSLINPSKILKILNLTTKYEGVQDLQEDAYVYKEREKETSLIIPKELQKNNPNKERFDSNYNEDPNDNNYNKGIVKNQYYQEQQNLSNSKKEQHYNDNTYINEQNHQKNDNFERKSIRNSTHDEVKQFSLEELLKNPLECYEQLHDLDLCYTYIEPIIKNISVKALMTVKSLIKPDQELLRICGSFCILQGKALDPLPLSWTSIQKILASPSQTINFLKDFQKSVRQREFENQDALSFAKKNILLKGPLLQNCENSLILETVKKLAGFTILALKYIELYSFEKKSIYLDDFNSKSVKYNDQNYQIHQNYHKYNERNHPNDKYKQYPQKPEENEIFDNEFLEEEQPSILKVHPFKHQPYEPAQKTPPISPKPPDNNNKSHKTPIKSPYSIKMAKPNILSKLMKNNNYITRPLIYEDTITPSKKPILIKKESKFDKIMRIKVRKPKAVSQVRLYLYSQMSSPMKQSLQRMNKSVELGEKSLSNSKNLKRDTSEPIGERLIKKDIENLRKEMKKLDSQKTKLSNAFTKELKKVEQYKSLKEREDEKKKELELEKRFNERRKFEMKQEKMSQNEQKVNEVNIQRLYKNQLIEQKKKKEQEEYENYVRHHQWLETTRERSKEEIKERNQRDLEEIEFKRLEKRRKAEQERKEITEEVQKNKETTLLQKHRDMLSKKEYLEKQLEETLSVIMKIRESYKDFDL